MAHQLKAAASIRRRKVSLWNKDNREEQGIVKFIPKYADVLKEKGPELCEIIQHEDLWRFLKKYDVTDRFIEDRIRAHDTSEDIVDHLLHHIECGPAWRLHALLRACTKRHQEHVVTLLGLDPDDYSGPSPPPSPSSSTKTSHAAQSTTIQHADIQIPTEQSDNVITSSPPPLTATKDVPPTELQGCSHGSPPVQNTSTKQPSTTIRDPGLYSGSAPPSKPVISQSRVDKDKQQQQQQQEEEVFMRILTASIQSHRDVYNRTLMQGRLFDIPSLDLPYDMEWCYMQVVATSDELLQNPVDILPADILKAKPGKPKLKTVLLSGHPGTGKSSFIRFYGHRWSQMKAGESEWDLIVILNVSTLKLTEGLSPREHIKEAIQQSLEGRGDKEAIMKSLDDDSLNILIIPDGMDECRSFTILDMLRELISSCYKGELGFTVLATCRSGLCPIRESLFDRRLKIDGFKTQEGVQYVQRFYAHIQKPDDELVYDYIANNQEDLNHILTNPLCTHILSVVTADGTLKLTKGQKLRLKDLFLAMEKSMKRRQLEKLMQNNLESMPTKEQLEDEIRCFYRMCLWALLQDVRTFDDHIMDQFGINAHHPYLTFMTKVKKYNSDLQDISYWRFNHTMFHEYFAASALEALPNDMCLALFLTISSNRTFRNTQKILFSALGEDVDQLAKLTDMIRVNLITQGEWDVPDAQTKATIDGIKEKCKASIDLVDILNTLIPGEKGKMDPSFAQADWQTVSSFFEDQLENLPTSFFDEDSETSPIPHIHECLHELPEEHQQLVFEASFGCALPSVGMQGNVRRQIVYNTGGRRWVVVEETMYLHAVQIHIKHSLTDASEAVQQYGQQHLDTWLKDTQAIILGYTSEYLPVGWSLSKIWGEPKHDQFLSKTLWSDLLTGISNWSVTVNKLEVGCAYFPRGVVGFLQCLQIQHTQDALSRLLVQDKGGRLRIKVYYGHIDMDSLLEWTDWYLQQDLLQVQLVDLDYEITGTDSTFRQDQVRRVKNLKLLKHNGIRLLHNRNNNVDLFGNLPRLKEDGETSSDTTEYEEVESELTEYEEDQLEVTESTADSNQSCCSSCTLI